MKSSEIATIILIVLISSVSAFFVGQAIWGDPGEKSHKVGFMEEITDRFAEPSKDIFNEEAINPTVQVVIGQDEGQVNYGQKIDSTQSQQNQ